MKVNNNLNEQEWDNIIGKRFHLIYRDANCLKVIVNFCKGQELNDKKFASFLSYLYRIIYDRLYIEVYKILDNRKDVLSLKKFLYKIDCENYWKDIEDHITFPKIKSRRHDILAHDNLQLALNQSKATEHYENNKMYLSEFMEFLEFLLSKFEGAIATRGEPIFHYALGEENEVQELNELLQIAFPKDT